jgi:GNAT superfamily N-acetyltransferase
MTQYVIREARPQELAIVIRHRRRMYEDMGHTDPVQLADMERASTQFFGHHFAAGTYRGWFAEIDGLVVAGGGVLILPFQPQMYNTRPERPWIVNMFTEPEHRRQGLARLLLEEMVAWCRRESFSLVWLHASDEGRSVYTTMGFQPSNEMRLRLNQAAQD